MSNQGRSKHILRVLNVLVLLVFIVILCTVVLFPGPSHVLGNRGKKLTFTSTLSPIKTVFLIVMENQNWASILGNASAPYINQTLLPMASYATQYSTPPHNHPSLPNYLWLEAGTNFGITNDKLPSINHQSTTNHLVTLLGNAGYTWKAYEEDISGTVCPLKNVNRYLAHHNPFVYFDDVTGKNNAHNPYCIAHEVPYAHLATDLANNTAANYNYIGPNACDDMHNTIGCPSMNAVKNGDTWLSLNVPQILNSQAYQSGGVLFIAWDEGNKGSDGPIGMIMLSPYAKGHGYSNAIHYTHSSTLLTIEEIFGLTPLLGGAATATATDLSDLFLPPPPTPTPTPSPIPSPTDIPTATLTATP